MAALALLVTAATAQDARHENIVVRTVTSDDGGDHGSKSMTIVLDGEDVSVQVDGKPIPTDRIRWENGKIIILDEHGKDIKILPHLSSTADGTVGARTGTSTLTWDSARAPSRSGPAAVTLGLVRKPTCLRRR